MTCLEYRHNYVRRLLLRYGYTACVWATWKMTCFKYRQPTPHWRKMRQQTYIYHVTKSWSTYIFPHFHEYENQNPFSKFCSLMMSACSISIQDVITLRFIIIRQTFKTFKSAFVMLYGFSILGTFEITYTVKYDFIDILCGIYYVFELCRHKP